MDIITENVKQNERRDKFNTIGSVAPDCSTAMESHEEGVFRKGISLVLRPILM
jgi:hypothetical protein